VNTLRDKIAAAIDAVGVLSSTEFSWFGRAEGRLPASIARSIDPPTARAHLQRQLMMRLYGSFYLFGRPLPDDQTVKFPSEDPNFVEALSSSNAGAGSQIEGWDVLSLDGEALVVERTGLILTVPQAKCTFIGDGKVSAGGTVTVQLPNERRGLSPGFYMATSGAEEAFGEAPPLLRVYWHLGPQGAAPLTAQLTRRLNERNLPFRFKVLNQPASYTRCDSAVLYLRQSDYELAVDSIVAAHREIAPWMRAGVPAFTKRLACGLGLAEDPSGDESFGLQRCRILAEALLVANDQATQDRDERLAVVERQFNDAGIALESPYLNPGSTNTYLFPSHLAEPREVRPNAAKVVRGNELSSDGPLPLESAHAIARQLGKSALWHDDRCTWLSPTLKARHAPSGQEGDTSFDLLGADLYRGTAGVALFLSEVATATADVEIRKTAIAAMRQSLQSMESVPESARWGLHSGRIGIAVAAARIGQMMESASFVEASREIVRGLQATAYESTSFDILSGKAGGILGLLTLDALLAEPAYLELAGALGDSLVDSAEPCQHGCSWSMPQQPKAQRNLTGYSHGTAGVSHALLELYAATGNQSYRATAQQALAYERAWYSADRKNWPDFRTSEGQPRGRRQAYPFQCAWCHGAPGIALSRLRAFELLGDERYRTEAEAALETTRQGVLNRLESGIGDTGLCHGLAGNCEILVEGDRILAQRRHGDIVARAIRESIRVHAMDDRGPRQIVAERGAEMMVGLTGVGYALLRTTLPEVPSLLVVRAAQWKSDSHAGQCKGTGRRQSRRQPACVG